MAYCSSSFSSTTTFSHISSLPYTSRRNPLLVVSVKAVKSPEPENEKGAQTKAQEPSKPQASTTATKLPKKPVYSMKKGQIVRVDKEKYLNSINIKGFLGLGLIKYDKKLQYLRFETKYLSVGHPPYYKGLDYIYEDHGEVLDLKIFETGEYALIAWVGVPTAPAWLPTEMLIKSDKLDYERI